MDPKVTPYLESPSPKLQLAVSAISIPEFPVPCCHYSAKAPSNGSEMSAKPITKTISAMPSTLSGLSKNPQKPTSNLRRCPAQRRPLPAHPLPPPIPADSPTCIYDLAATALKTLQKQESSRATQSRALSLGEILAEWATRPSSDDPEDLSKQQLREEIVEADHVRAMLVGVAARKVGPDRLGPFRIVCEAAREEVVRRLEMRRGKTARRAEGCK